MEKAYKREFRKWFYENCLSKDGVWLLFGKVGGPKTVKSGEVLKSGDL